MTDTDQVIAASGQGKKEAINQNLTSEFEKIVQNREQKLIMNTERGFINIYYDMTLESAGILVTSIIYEGNVIGSIVIAQKEGKEKIGEVEKKLALVGAHYLGNQME